MRFEAKHQCFKKLASADRNFKNVALTMAKRHQLRQCWGLISVDFFSEANMCTGEISLLFRDLLECQKSQLLAYFRLSQDSSTEILWKCSTLTHEGIYYKIHDVVIVYLLHSENIPLFFKICQIIKFRESWIFIAKLLVSKSYSSHYHELCVKEEDEFSLCQPSQLCDHQLLDCYKLQDNESYVAVKYNCFL